METYLKAKTCVTITISCFCHTLYFLSTPLNVLKMNKAKKQFKLNKKVSTLTHSYECLLDRFCLS